MSAKFKQLWNENKLTELADAIFNHATHEEQSEWLYILLFLSIDHNKEYTPSQITKLLDVLGERNSWFECKQIFFQIRPLLLKYENENTKDRYLIGICSLAETISKVVYNFVSADVGGYNKSAYKYIPSCVKYLIDHSNDVLYKEKLIEHLIKNTMTNTQHLGK